MNWRAWQTNYAPTPNLRVLNYEGVRLDLERPETLVELQQDLDYFWAENEMERAVIILDTWRRSVTESTLRDQSMNEAMFNLENLARRYNGPAL